MIRSPAFPPRFALAVLLLATAGLAACASGNRSVLAPRAVVPVDESEPLPPGIKPLTLEQEEAVNGGVK